MANKQTKSQNKCKTKGNKYDSEQSVVYIDSNTEGGETFTHFRLQLFEERLPFAQVPVIMAAPAPTHVKAATTSVTMRKRRSSSFKMGAEADRCQPIVLFSSKPLPVLSDSWTQQAHCCCVCANTRPLRRNIGNSS